MHLCSKSMRDAFKINNGAYIHPGSARNERAGIAVDGMTMVDVDIRKSPGSTPRTILGKTKNSTLALWSDD